MKTDHASHRSVSWRLPPLWWTIACIFLATQGYAAAATAPCRAAEAASGVDSSMPGMSDAPVMSESDDSSTTDDGCQHCHPYRQGQDHGCAQLHSCNSPLAAAAPSVFIGRAARVHAGLLPMALPRIISLAFDPPLRPPPA